MSQMNRREFMVALAALTGAAAGPAILTAGCKPEASVGEGTATPGANGPSPRRPPNFLLVLSDEFGLPPKYPDGAGMPAGLREILGFEADLAPDNPFVSLFPGFTRLRRNAVAFRSHYVASAACVPSRATMLTGQYPTVHGVSQTTGFFKSGDDPGFVWLDPDGIPTAGDWFQAAGYQTYYFGKWHISETCDDLGPWGFPFAKWDGPEPHGSDRANLGVYRDPEIAGDTIDFLQQKGAEGDSPQPWFAVTSYLAPHDVTGWPMPWFLPGDASVQTAPPNYEVPPPIPAQGAMSHAGTPNSADAASDCPPPTSPPVALNPGGYPAGIFQPVPTLNEDLATKPDCQYDMSIKIGLCQKSSIPEQLRSEAPNPFQLQGEAFEAWTTAYGEWHTYLHYLLDIQINRVLQTLEEAGLRENTIVIFTCDHGDYAGAHGGAIQKWHTAYEEAIHVPFIVSSPLVNTSDTLLEFHMPTSHIDLLPTLLGLAGISPEEQEQLRERISGQGEVPALVGTDISRYVYDPALDTPIQGADGQERPGVLFMTIDEISEMTSLDPSNAGYPAFQNFLGLVDEARATLPRLAEGTIRQPNLVRTLTDGTWKYSRYYDPHGVEADQYELYHLPSDPIEAVNLVDFRSGQIRSDVSLPAGSPARLEAQRARMAAQLAAQEALLL
jgi:arylsulfatase A-like enzyme